MSRGRKPLKTSRCLAARHKIGYESRKDALRFKDKHRHFRAYPYRCPHCAKWHLTSSRRRPRKETG